MQPIPLIAVTGGPCGGKSTFLAHADALLHRHRIRPIVIPETATELITAGITPAQLGTLDFQEVLLFYQLDREEQYQAMAARLAEHERPVILCDRGALDAAAYVDPTQFDTLMNRLGSSRARLMERYALVVHLTTAADGAEAHYTHTNNAARSETPEEARALDWRTQHAWIGHPHHVIIDNSTDFAEKMRRALGALARVLNMPAPTEIERKWRILNFAPSFIPEDAAVREITQDYLADTGGAGRRVRKSVYDGEIAYFYTEKMSTAHPATRIERERRIGELEYEQLLRERAPDCRTVKKTRYCFVYAGKLLEVDVFHADTAPGLVLVEVELQDPDEPVTLPPEWQVKEVTEDPAYQNATIARAA